MFENLNQPYIFNNNFKHSIKTIMLVTMGYMLIVLYFQPFGINFLNSSGDGYFVLGSGIFTALTFFVNTQILQGIFPKTFDPKQWTIKKEIIQNICMFIFLSTSFGILGYFLKVKYMEHSMPFILSCALALLPIGLFNLSNYNNSLKLKVVKVFDSGKHWLAEEMKHPESVKSNQTEGNQSPQQTTQQQRTQQYTTQQYETQQHESQQHVNQHITQQSVNQQSVNQQSVNQQSVNQQSLNQQQPENLQPDTQPETIRQVVFTSENMKETVTYNTDDIVVLRSSGNYVEIYYKNGKAVSKNLIRQTLSNLEGTLADYPQFIRSHRCYLVNTRYSKKLSLIGGNYSLNMHGVDFEIPVSRNKHTEVRKSIA